MFLDITLGEGTFGKVKLGYHILTNEKVINLWNNILNFPEGCSKNITKM